MAMPKTILFCLIVSYHFLNCLANPHNGEHHGSPEAPDTHTAQYAHSEMTTDDDSTEYACNADHDGHRRAKTAVQPPFSDSTTESGVTTEMDMSYLSEEFKNCSAHVQVEPECFQKLPNGSVHVLSYGGAVFDRPDYMISDGLLYICPLFIAHHEEDEAFYVDSIVASSAVRHRAFSSAFMLALMIVGAVRCFANNVPLILQR